MDKFAEVIEKSLEAAFDSYKQAMGIIEQQETQIQQLDGELFEARSDAKVFRSELERLAEYICNGTLDYSDCLDAAEEVIRWLEERDKE